VLLLRRRNHLVEEPQFPDAREHFAVSCPDFGCQQPFPVCSRELRVRHRQIGDADAPCPTEEIQWPLDRRSRQTVRAARFSALLERR
jgi:hypothetical protein